MAQSQIRGNTQIKAGTITNTEVSASAAIATTKLADGASFTKRDGSVLPLANWDFNSYRITNLSDPSSPQDAATKNYVDSISQSLDIKASVRVATTGVLAATRSSNTLTAGSNGDINSAGIDSVTTLALNDRILVKDQSTGADNGIYLISDLGSAGTPWVLTRSTDANTSAKVTAGLYTFVEEGTTQADTGWVLITNNPITLNTTSLTFSQFTGAGSYSGGNGINVTGTVISVKNGNGLTFSGTDLTINLADSTLTVGVAGLKLSALTSAYLLVGNGSNVATGVALSGDATLSNTGALTIANSAITNVKVSGTAAIDFAKLATLTSGNILVGNGSGVATSVAMSGDVTISNTGVTTVNSSTFLKKANFIIRETPTGTIDGVNDTFVLANTPVAGSEQVFLNSILQEPGGSNDYTISGATITYLTPPVTGDRLRVTYLT